MAPATTNGVGFHADLERMAERGWAIEVLSWTTPAGGRSRVWAAEAGVYVPLETFFYPSVTFIEGGRRSIPISLRQRRTAKPRAAAGSWGVNSA